jgi:HD-GYP domain-containing protein (c-di-GMP phosphodiesterase class II)
LEHSTLVNLLSDVHDDTENITVTLSLLEQFATVVFKLIAYCSECTSPHSQDVTVVAEALRQLMRLDVEVCSKLKIAGLLHDLGMVAEITSAIKEGDAD